jgi:hypothetical protein
MKWLPRILATSFRTERRASLTRSQKPRLESLEERALQSANPVTLHYPIQHPASVSSHTTAIVTGADSGHGTTSYLRSAGTVCFTVRHAVA